MALQTGPQVVDAELQVTKALPNGAATVASDGIDLGLSSNGRAPETIEILIEAPALTTVQLPDTQTMIYVLYHDSDSAFGTEESLYGTVLTQTGAGGAGAAAASKRVALPSDVARHIRVKATNSGAGDASGVSLTMSLLV